MFHSLLGPGTIHTYISRPLFGRTISWWDVVWRIFRWTKTRRIFIFDFQLWAGVYLTLTFKPVQRIMLEKNVKTFKLISFNIIKLVVKRKAKLFPLKCHMFLSDHQTINIDPSLF